MSHSRRALAARIAPIIAIKGFGFSRGGEILSAASRSDEVPQLYLSRSDGSRRRLTPSEGAAWLIGHPRFFGGRKIPAEA